MRSLRRTWRRHLASYRFIWSIYYWEGSHLVSDVLRYLRTAIYQLGCHLVQYLGWFGDGLEVVWWRVELISVEVNNALGDHLERWALAPFSSLYGLLNCSLVWKSILNPRCNFWGSGIHLGLVAPVKLALVHLRVTRLPNLLLNLRAVIWSWLNIVCLCLMILIWLNCLLSVVILIL